MKKRYIALTIMTACTGTLMAQEMTQEKYQLADERQLWGESLNAAGLAHDMCDSADNRGVAYFDLMHRSGDYRRVQEGGQLNQLRFFTERYQKIGKYLYGYGSFDFDMGRTKDRAWSDVLRTYNSNPYISGSSVTGKYDHQNFTLNAKLASVRLGHFNYGVAFKYKVGDLSRLRDPRSRVRLADYQLTPSATYTTGSHTLGLSAYYHRYKEKLTGLTTVQTDPGLKYYIMTGMEHATGSVGGYTAYWREYVNHDFGGELSYAYQGDGFRSLNSVTLGHGTEYVYGQYKYEPGTWYTYNYGFSTRNRIDKGNLLHSIDASVNYQQAYADEYKSQLITEKDGPYTTQWWQRTMTFDKRYQLKKLDLNAHYRLSFVKEQAVKGFVGVKYDLHTADNKYLLSTSQQKTAGSTFQAEGGYSVIERYLWIEGAFDYHVSHKADLDLHDATTDYAQAVLLPDMEYYGANYWQGHLAVTCQFPLTIKGFTSQWFVKLYGDYLKTNNSLKRQTAGLSFGVYY